MEQLIDDIYEIIKDYRSDEGLPHVGMTKQRIRRWIEQFDEADREFILTEMKNIFAKRYCSKAKAKDFLKKVVDKLTEDLKYKSPQEFLAKTVFLDLQPEGKSQKTMLKLLREILQSEYHYTIPEYYPEDVKHFVYLDDVLCTGNTLFQDMKEWCEGWYDEGTKNIDAIKDGTADFICAFIFIHEKNYYKKKAEMRHKICNEISEKHKMYRMFEIENSEGDVNAALDFVFPLEANQPQIVYDYKDKIVEQVDEYTKRYNSTSREEFYRTAGRPQTEKLFSSADNRTRFENIMLKQGVEVLNRANTRVKNMRALGFSLPSQKNFGFGTLCFTWRNVANNTPLVFWYSGGGLFPFFVKNQTNNVL